MPCLFHKLVGIPSGVALRLPHSRQAPASGRWHVLLRLRATPEEVTLVLNYLKIGKINMNIICNLSITERWIDIWQFKATNSEDNCISLLSVSSYSFSTSKASIKHKNSQIASVPAMLASLFEAELANMPALLCKSTAKSLAPPIDSAFSSNAALTFLINTYALRLRTTKFLTVNSPKFVVQLIQDRICSGCPFLGLGGGLSGGIDPVLILDEVSLQWLVPRGQALQFSKCFFINCLTLLTWTSTTDWSELETALSILEATCPKSLLAESISAWADATARSAPSWASEASAKAWATWVIT